MNHINQTEEQRAVRQPAPNEIVQYNRLKLIVDGRVLLVGRKDNHELPLTAITLTKTECAIVAGLLANGGNTLPYESLKRMLWETDRPSGTSIIRVYLKRLRDKLEPHEVYIETLAKKGIRVNC